MNSQLNVKILRNGKASTHSFTDYFKGFEQVETIKHLFGKKTEETLRNLRVEFLGAAWAYMAVSDLDGHLIVSVDYLKNGDFTSLYLDIIHELTHVKQFMEGKELFDGGFSYTERPTEIEAYRNAVEEAKRLGIDDTTILEYLKTEWMSEEDHSKLAQALNVKPEKN
ncbi:MAG: ImmA/IrrE family metallo-endopeptidase [Candidatus Bathyarchaeia archaeon]